MNSALKIHHARGAVTRTLINDFFSPFGTIRKVTLPNRSADFAIVEFTTELSAKNAMRELDGTTLKNIKKRNKVSRNASSEFIWSISQLGEEYLWEEDSNDRTKLEKEIVRKKVRNMQYIESLGSSLPAKEVRQRPVVRNMPVNLEE
ncbi:uncharacterized protein NEMAJ01_0655 [Nematocida major]|uniref:uncharacterized protein n=1 Tax=Nematocida major TaxID=1912982 RepID=UPI002008A2BE|nr:uncharacterized protein NEMAJ01_0655 [Nematocida major]KAH9385759.1 hypothetical protein NEMAJ01_0655 [Nematocida major]